jgi:LacI family transcriptional regulator
VSSLRRWQTSLSWGTTIDTHDRRPATIVDVAREAGVSFKTVSRVLNGEPNVREPTRQLVLQAVKTLGYRANPYARNLRAAQSRIIAVYFSNPSRNYTSEIQIGVLQRCNAEGFNAIFEDASAGPDGLVSLRGEPNLAGVILVAPLTEDPAFLRRLSEADIPFVRLAPADAAGETGHVSMDDEARRRRNDGLSDLARPSPDRLHCRAGRSPAGPPARGGLPGGPGAQRAETGARP